MNKVYWPEPHPLGQNENARPPTWLNWVLPVVLIAGVATVAVVYYRQERRA